MKNLLSIVLCLVLSGCATAPTKAVDPYADPQYGMTKQQMVALMGKPDTMEIYKRPDQTRVEFDIYMRYFPTSQLKVPVCLIDNKVVGWGKSYYEDHVSPDDIRIK